MGPRWRRRNHRRSNHRRGGQDVAATESTRSSTGWPVPHPRRSPRRPPTPRRGSHVLGDADPSGPARRAVKRKIVRPGRHTVSLPPRPHDRRRRPVVSGRQPGPIPAARARGSVSPCREADPGQKVRQPRRLRRPAHPADPAGPTPPQQRCRPSMPPQLSVDLVRDPKSVSVVVTAVGVLGRGTVVPTSETRSTSGRRYRVGGPRASPTAHRVAPGRTRFAGARMNESTGRRASESRGTVARCATTTPGRP